MPGPVNNTQNINIDYNGTKVEINSKTAPLKTPQVIPVDTVLNYFSNTMSKAGEEMPVVSNAPNVAPAKPQTSSDMIEITLKTYSNQVDASLADENRDFEKLLHTINKIIMLQMRKAVQADQEFIFEITIKKTEKSLQIKGTYNTWTGTTITVIAAGVSIVGGLMPFAPFLPAGVLGAVGLTREAAASIAPGAQAVGNAGSGMSGVVQILNSRNEGDRSIFQTELQGIDTKKDDRSGSKQHHKEAIKTAKTAISEFDRQYADVVRSVCPS